MRYSIIAVAAFAALTSLAVAAEATDSKATTAETAGKAANKSTDSGSASAANAASEKAPDFTVKDESGKEHSLAGYKGKVVVLLWTNPGAPDGDDLKGGCPFITGRVKGGSIENIAKSVTSEGAVFLAVNSGAVNKPEDSKAVAEKFKQSYATLQDADGKIGHAYSATNTPQAVVIGQDGNIVYTGAINDNNSADESKDAGAKDYVKAAVQAALKNQKPEVTKTKAYGCSVKYGKSA